MLSFVGDPEQARNGLKRICVSLYAVSAEMTVGLCAMHSLNGTPICLILLLLLTACYTAPSICRLSQAGVRKATDGGFD